MGLRVATVLVVVTVASCNGVWASEESEKSEELQNRTETINSVESGQVFFKAMSLHCSKKYSLTCFKLDAVRLVDRLGHTPAYRLLPGISLVHSNYSQMTEFPSSVVMPLAEGNATALDAFLSSRVTEYLNSLTLAVKVLDSGTVSSARKLSERILTGALPSDQQTGRKKGYGGALFAAGSMAAVGMAALAAVAGKAMMTSMLALMLAAAGAMRGGGGGGGGGEKCGSYAFPAAKRSIAIQEHPVYRNAYAPSYGVVST